MNFTMVENIFRQRRFEQIDSATATIKLFREIYVEDIPVFTDVVDQQQKVSGRTLIKNTKTPRAAHYEHTLNKLRDEGYLVSWKPVSVKPPLFEMFLTSNVGEEDVTICISQHVTEEQYNGSRNSNDVLISNAILDNVGDINFDVKSNAVAV